VHDFMYKSDNRTHLFVMNQLRKRLGNRKPLKRAKVRTKERRLELEAKKQAFFDKLSAQKPVILVGRANL